MQPLRIYTTDLSFYKGYIEKLVDEARAGFSPAVARMAACVPRLADIPVKDIPSVELTIEDARHVYAVEHSSHDWEAFAAFVGQVASGSREEPYVQFIHAVERGDTDVIKRILDHSPDLVHQIASTGKSPLHSSANAKVATELMSRGAPVDMECLLPGGTALMHALLWGKVEKAEAIAAVSLAPGNLRVAAGLGRMDLLQKMWLPNGALAPEARAGRTYYRPNYGWFAWEASDDDQEVLDEALIYAVTNGRLDAAQYLLNRGADVNGLAYNACPLTRGAWQGQREVIDWLLDRGADVNGTSWLGGHVKGGTALHIVAENGQFHW